MLGKPDRQQLEFVEDSTGYSYRFMTIAVPCWGRGIGASFVKREDIGDVVKAVDSHLTDRPDDDLGISHV